MPSSTADARAYSPPPELHRYRAAPDSWSWRTCAMTLGMGMRLVPTERTKVSSTSTKITRCLRWGLTPELSRAAKRRRLGRIVRPMLKRAEPGCNGSEDGRLPVLGLAVREACAPACPCVPKPGGAAPHPTTRVRRREKRAATDVAAEVATSEALRARSQMRRLTPPEGQARQMRVCRVTDRHTRNQCAA